MRIFWLGFATAITAGAVGTISGVAAQEAAAPSHGQTLFMNRCARCHGVGGDAADGLAPPLIGVVGRPIAGHPAFPYTDALKAKAGRWTPDTLDIFLTDPQAVAPGTEMVASLPDPAERAAVIGYLGTLK